MSPTDYKEVEEGEVLEGKYRLIEELGAGGMGQVYLAQHETIERQVAIKVLHRDLANDESVRRRFEREAKAIARLRHPNCVMLYEFGFSEEFQALFAVFEYVEGCSLEEFIGREFPVGDVVEIGAQVAGGMAHAHDQKIIHRDLKPENIMVVPHGDRPEVKVLDFGIARIAEEDEKRTRLTKMGQMFGTPPYMSPEQVRAKLNVTYATDIYAIGVIMYELLEGRLPFLGDTPIETAMMHLNDDVPDIEREGVPQDLMDVVFRCLEKDADDRFDNCGELESALRAVEWKGDGRTVLTEEELEDREAQAFKSTVADTGDEQSGPVEPTIDEEEIEAAAARVDISIPNPDDVSAESDSDDPESASEAVSIPESEAESELEHDKRPESESEAEPVAVSEVAAESEPEPQTVSESDVDTEPAVDDDGQASFVDDGSDRWKLFAGVAVAAMVAGAAVIVVMFSAFDPGDGDPTEQTTQLQQQPEDDESAVAVEPTADDEQPAERTGEEFDTDEGLDDVDGDADEPPEEAVDEAAAEPTVTEEPATPPPVRPDEQPDEDDAPTRETESSPPAAEPDPIEMRRRRTEDDDETEKDEQEVEQPEGIGLPDRDDADEDDREAEQPEGIGLPDRD